MKKLLKLIQKYLVGRLDLSENCSDSKFPIVAYGILYEQHGTEKYPIGRYMRWILPCFRFGFEQDGRRKMEVAAWRVPDLCYVEWVDDLGLVEEAGFQFNWMIWEEDERLTCEEEARRLTSEKHGAKYRAVLRDRYWCLKIEGNQTQ